MKVFMCTACAAALALAVVAPAAAQIAEMNGTWVLNTEKTLGPRPESETLVFKISEHEQSYTMDFVDSEGQEGHAEWAVKYDGQDHPTTAGSNRTVSIRQLGSKTEFVVNKRDGVVTSTYTRVLVDDDNTIMSIGRDSDGTIQWVRVFEKR